MRKHLTPEQTFQLNRTLRHLASELERRKAIRELERQLAESDALISAHANAIDANPRSTWPKGSLLAAAIDRHGERCRSEEQAQALANDVYRLCRELA